jgi:hypothetical protein
MYFRHVLFAQRVYAVKLYILKMKATLGTGRLLTIACYMKQFMKFSSVSSFLVTDCI